MTQAPQRGGFDSPDLAILDAARIDPLDIRGLLRCLWQGKWLIMLTTVLAVLLAGYYAFAMAKPRYAATVTFQIEQPQNLKADGSGTEASAPANLNTQAAILRSYALLDQVVAQLDLQADPEFNRYLTSIAPWSLRGLRIRVRSLLSGQAQMPPDTAAITAKTLENLQNAIVAVAQKDSAVFSITATTGSEQKSIHIANTLAALYLTTQSENARAATERSVAWLSEKMLAQQVELARKETAISDLVTLAQVTDQATLDGLSRQAHETEQRLRDARATLAALTGADAASAAQPLGGNARRLQGQIATLEAQRASLGTQLAAQSAGLVQLHQLQREADASRVLYQTYLNRLQDVSLQTGLQSAQSRILSPAGPARYVAPRKMLILAIAALLGAVFGVIWAFVRDGMRSGFRDPSELRKATGVPVMALLPATRARKPIQMLDGLGGGRSRALLDAAANLRTSLLFAAPDEPPQTILCTSSIGDEGRAAVSIALAHSLAGLGKSVLLIDGDSRCSGLWDYLQNPVQSDLVAVVGGHVPIGQAVTRDARWSVDVLTGQSGPQANPDLFCGASFADFMHRQRERYDYIVMHAPPVLPVADARILAQHADAVVYAVRWNKTPSDVIRAGQRELESVQAPITGLVMSQVDLRGMRRQKGATWQSYSGSYANA